MIRLTKTEIILASLASSNGATHTPIQVQKLLFLIDKKVADKLGGPFFNFTPYDYGPLDKEVYAVLSELANQNQVEIISNIELRWNKYRLTPEGQNLGCKILKGLSGDLSEYIEKLSAFIRSLSFVELVSVIYSAYPEMKVNSVFQK